MNLDIPIEKLLYVLALYIPVFLIMKKLEITLKKRLFINISRMIFQLFLVGLYLQYLFKLNSPIINLIYLIFMALVGGFEVITPLPLKKGRILPLISLGVFVVLIPILLVFRTTLSKIPPLLDARFTIPISGMIIGNMVRSMVVTLGAFLRIFIEREERYLIGLSLGGAKGEILDGYIRESMEIGLTPLIANYGTIGIVSLPGMMTGQILGGTLPITAIKYQIVISSCIFVGVFLSNYLILNLFKVTLFDEYHMFRKNLIK